MIRLFFTFLAFLIVFEAAAAVSPLDTVRYNRYYKKAEKLRDNKKFQDAIDAYKKALSNNDVLLNELIINYRIAGMFGALGKTDSAEFWAGKNLAVDQRLLTTNELKVEVARSYSTFRSSAIRRGDYHAVEEALTKGIKILEDIDLRNLLLCTYYIDMGINQWRMGNDDPSIAWCEKAMRTSLELTGKDATTAQIRASIMIGLVYRNKRHLQKAIDYYKQVFRLIGNDVAGNIRDFTINCNNLGIVYMERGQYDSANLNYQNALSHLDQIGVDFADQISSYKSEFLNNIGLNYSGLHKYKEAEVYHKQALQYRIRISGELHQEVARILLDLAVACYRQEKYEEAYRYLGKSLKIRKNLKDISSVEISKSYNIFGDLYYDQGDFNRSKAYYDSALMANPRINLANEIVYADVRESWYSLSGKMKNLVEDKSLSQEKLNELESLYNDIRTQMNYALTRTSDPILQQDVKLLFDDLFEVYYQLFENTGKREFLDRLWQVAEYKKGFRLNSQLNNQIAMTSLLPKDLLQKEKTIKDSLTLLTEKKFDGDDRDSLIFIYKKKYDNFIATLESKYPEYYALKYSVIQTPLHDAEAMIGDGTISANFFETKNHVYTICLSQDGVFVSKCESALLDSLVTKMNYSILNRDTPQTRTYSIALKEILFPSSLDFKKIKTLELLPDGRTWKVHFSLLTDTDVNGKTDYLGKTINILYQYSFDHLRLAGKSKKQNNSKVLAFSSSNQSSTITALSPVTFRDFDSDLPGTSVEIRQISEDWDGDYYFSTLASESAFKEKYPGYQIIHLALHGLIDDVDPSYSKLKFNAADSTDDGLLYAYEIYNLKVNAELVVLSACNSGNGKIENGEGIESLGRAFAFAGANSLVLSKWEVSDAITPLIMKYFYQGLKDGLPKSEALRLAKMKFLEHDADNITSSPYYWDSFYVLGDDRPIEKNNVLNLVLIAAGVVILIFLVRYFLK